MNFAFTEGNRKTTVCGPFCGDLSMLNRNTVAAAGSLNPEQDVSEELLQEQVAGELGCRSCYNLSI